MRYFGLIFVLFFAVFLPLKANSQLSKFNNNEKLTYVVKWTGIPAGEIVMSSRLIEAMGNIRFFDTKMTARTNGMLSMVYNVREDISSRVSVDKFRSITFNKTSRQGRRHYTESFNFNYNDKKVNYIRMNLAKGGKPDKREYKIDNKDDRIFDPLSVLFHLRNIKFDDGKKVSPPMKVFADKKGIYTIQYKLKKTTYINSKGFGRRKVYNIEPSAEFKGTIVSKGKLELWVDVETGIIMRLKMSIPIGYASLELSGTQNSKLKYKSYRSRRRR
jgi:hypothetical protein